MIILIAINPIEFIKHSYTYVAIKKRNTDLHKYECDISHFQSSYLGGTCVRFSNGLPDNNNFRRFKMRTLKELIIPITLRLAITNCDGTKISGTKLYFLNKNMSFFYDIDALYFHFWSKIQHIFTHFWLKIQDTPKKRTASCISPKLPYYRVKPPNNFNLKSCAFLKNV